MLQDKIKTIIKEEYNKFLIREFMQPSFNWEKFNNLLETQGIVAAKKYCIKHLGQPIGEGTSRIVFEIDDHTVLKLSLSKNDVLQNIHECHAYEKLNHNPLLPRIYGHSDDFVWVWSERVLPCVREDFEKILGIPYNLQEFDDSENEDIEYDEYQSPSELEWELKDSDDVDNKLDYMRFIEWYADYSNEYEYLWGEEEMATFREWLKHPWFQYLTELMEYQPIDEFFDDNFGITIRNGKPTIVVLDIGWV